MYPKKHENDHHILIILKVTLKGIPTLKVKSNILIYSHY